MAAKTTSAGQARAMIALGKHQSAERCVLPLGVFIVARRAVRISLARGLCTFRRLADRLILRPCLRKNLFQMSAGFGNRIHFERELG